MVVAAGDIAEATGAEIVPVTAKKAIFEKGTNKVVGYEDATLTKDEGNRADTTLEGLAMLRPVRENGTITAGNASQLSDGASATAATMSGLEVAGVKSSEYRLVTVGKDGDAIEALVSGKVDAAALPYYEFIPFIVAGRKLRIFPHPALQNVTNSGYASAPRVLAAKGPEVKRFSRAIVKSCLLIRYNPKAAARAILIAIGAPHTDADLARKTAELNAWQTYLPAADPDVHGVLVVRRGSRRALPLLLLVAARRAALGVHPSRRRLRHPRRALAIGARPSSVHTLSHGHPPVISGQSPDRLAPI